MEYLIIDNNEGFVKKLFEHLTSNKSNSENDTLKSSSENLYEFAESIKSIPTCPI